MDVRPYQAGDEHQILGLFQLSFGRPLSPAYWKWRFVDNPEGKMMIRLMWDGDVLAGHYAVSPIRLQVEEQSVLTALSMVTMTHPAYAGRGIFTQLAEALYLDEASKSDLAAVWGYPNDNSHYAFIKNLGWKNLEQVPTFSIDAGRIPDRPSDVFVMESLAGRELCCDSSRAYPVFVRKTHEYLNWRYVTHPSNSYTFFGLERESETCYAVAKLFTPPDDSGRCEIDLCEWEVPAEAAMLESFLAAISRHYRGRGVTRLNMWLPLEDRKHILLEKLGFRNLAPVTYSGIRLLKHQTGLLRSSNWHYSMGHSDIY